MKDVALANEGNWQMKHWRSLESAYRKSPYFEFYEDEFIPHYIKKYKYLIDFTGELLQKIISLLKLDVEIKFTESYEEKYPMNDYRNFFPNKKETLDKNFSPQFYTQVFNGFYPNLSILDLLFCMGKDARDIINDSVS